MSEQRHNIWMALGETHVQQGKFELGVRYLNDGLTASKLAGDKAYEREYHQSLYRINKQYGDTSAALEHHEHLHALTKLTVEASATRRLQLLQVQLGLERSQKEVELQRIRAEQLQLEISMKSTQLSSQALHLAKQTEILSRFRNELREIVRRTNDAVQAIRDVKEKLRELPCATIDWEKLEADFRAVHPEFLNRLTERFPDLTPMEVKICMLLRLQMTSPDIATMLCLSERNIENHRYRIRQKLGLGRQQNLHRSLEHL
jgi:DNA-binding CsgD family transcriptional regulator